jgi:hypothetical protein
MADKADKAAGGMPLALRKKLFRAIVETQDKGNDAVVTRRRVAKRFGVTEHVVRRIEEDGLEGEWPPL